MNAHHETPPEGPDDLRRIFEVWMDSEMKAMIAVFYARNPGVVETLEGLARRLGTSPEALRDHVASHIRLGLLQERDVHGKTVLVFDRDRRAEFEAMIEDKIRERMEGNA